MNWLHSSQVRIALVSVLTSAVGLLAFGGFAWWQMHSSNIAALDRELLSLGRQTALAAKWELSAEQLESALRARFGEERAKGWIFAVEQNGRPPIKSAYWPQSLVLASMPHSEVVQVVPMPGPGFGEGFGGPGHHMGGSHGTGEPGHGPPPKPPSDFGLFFHAPFEEDSHEPPHGQPNADDRPPMSQPHLYAPGLLTVISEGHTYRMGVFGHAETGTVIHAGLDLAVFARELNRLVRAFSLALPASLLLVALGAWLAARRSLVPVQRLSRGMDSLSLGNLHQRLEVEGEDLEFRPIIAAYNAMLGRLERSYSQATRFSADASHELKTPIAVMRATVEEALERAPDGSAEQRVYAGLLDEIDNLQGITEALLILSRADAGKLILTTEPVEMAAWLEALAEDASLMAEARRITLHEDLSASATVAADPVLLYRAVHNLLRNAVAYNIEGGEIWCRSRVENRRFYLQVANTGLVVPEAEREKIFERFSRGTNAGGTGEGRGLGIGLSLAKEIIIAHGGTLRLMAEAEVTTFELMLPVAGQAGPACKNASQGLPFGSRHDRLV